MQHLSKILFINRLALVFTIGLIAFASLFGRNSAQSIVDDALFNANIDVLTYGVSVVLLLAAFGMLLGFKKTLSYGLSLLFVGLLFIDSITGWHLNSIGGLGVNDIWLLPALSSMILLYTLRQQDNFLNVKA